MRGKIWLILRNIFFILLILFAIDAVFFCCEHSPPIVTYILRFSGFSPRYSKIMDIPVNINGKNSLCELYQREGSPFLLVGPFPFLKDRADFFFVAKDFVQVRFLDEKTDDWTQFFHWVWIDQDMDPNGWDSYAPYYSFEETRQLDQKTGNLFFLLNDRNGKIYRFTIPARLVNTLPELNR